MSLSIHLTLFALLRSVYYVDSEGSCIPGNLFCVGSGSKLAYAVMDEYATSIGIDVPSQFKSSNDVATKQLDNLSEEDAVELAMKAVYNAASRDGYSGGYINVVRISSRGITHIRRVDSSKLVR